MEASGSGYPWTRHPRPEDRDSLTPTEDSDSYLTDSAPTETNFSHHSTHIEDLDLDQVFDSVSYTLGFQRDVALNACEFLKSQIQSRSVRLNNSIKDAVKSLHADYVSGRYANYRLWYMSEEMRESVEKEDPNMLTLERQKKSAKHLALRAWARKYKRIPISVNLSPHQSVCLMYLMVCGRTKSVIWLFTSA